MWDPCPFSLPPFPCRSLRLPKSLERSHIDPDVEKQPYGTPAQRWSSLAASKVVPRSGHVVDVGLGDLLVLGTDSNQRQSHVEIYV